MATINLRVNEQAVELYRETKRAALPGYLKLQLLRAASSVALNVAEGYGKPTARDRAKFFAIALGSAREVQAVVDLEPTAMAGVRAKADRLAAGLYKLTRNPS